MILTCVKYVYYDTFLDVNDKSFRVRPFQLEDFWRFLKIVIFDFNRNISLPL